MNTQRKLSLHYFFTVHYFHRSLFDPRYNKLVREIKVLAQKIMELPVDGFRVRHSGLLVERLHSMGVIETKRLKKCQKLSVKSFCRRRLPVFIISSGMFNGPLEMAVKYVQHGHVRVGPHVVKDPAFLVTRQHEDFLSWDEKMRQKIDTYNDTRDDYED